MNHEPAVEIKAPMLAALWKTTKRRVTSYWDAYYRRRGREVSLVFPRDDYVGFKIVERIETPAFR
jgi:hypothetical protein